MPDKATRTNGPEVVICGTLVADIRVCPFRPVPPGQEAIPHQVEVIACLAGGLVSNTGLALARLGVATAGIGRLGADTMGAVLFGVLATGGLQMDGIVQERGSATSTTLVCIDDQGERSFHDAAGANSRLGIDDIERNATLLAGARAIVLGYLGKMPEMDPRLPEVLAALKRDTKALIVLETSGPQSRTRALLDACLPFVDIFIPSWSEAHDLTGALTPAAALERLERAARPSILGVKLGARGCLVRDAQGVYEVPAYPVRVVDTTGAGDAFLAGFLAGFLRGEDTPTACRMGNMAGALFSTAIDGVPEIPPYGALLARVREGVGQGGSIA